VLSNKLAVQNSPEEEKCLLPGPQSQNTKGIVTSKENTGNIDDKTQGLLILSLAGEQATT
jgi:hypothetical protein